MYIVEEITSLKSQVQKLNLTVYAVHYSYICYCNYSRDIKNCTMLWTCRWDGNNKHVRNFVKEVIRKNSHCGLKCVTKLFWWII